MGTQKNHKFQYGIKVLNTDRRWREGTCLLICITFRPKNILIIIYQWLISHGRQYR